MVRSRQDDPRTVIATLPQLWLMFGVMQGLSRDELCLASGFRPEQIADRDRQVPRAWYVALRLAVIARLPQVAVGIEMGQLITPAHFGYFGLLLRHCETPREGMELTLRYGNFILGPVNETQPRIEDHAQTVDWVIPLASDDPPEATESHFIHTVATIRAWVGTRIVPRAVCFAHRREFLRARLQEIFSCPVEFGAVDSRIKFERGDVERPIEGADAELRKHLEAELSQHIRQREPFVSVVTRVIELQIAKGEVSQSRTARRLGMATRTLQRKLTEEGVTYLDLVSRVRRALGERLLADPTLAIYQVGFALGYRDVGAFKRAWRRWTGQSPRAFRSAASAAAREVTTEARSAR